MCNLKKFLGLGILVLAFAVIVVGSPFSNKALASSNHVIDIAAISGVTVPVTGAVPVTSTSDNGEYHTTISWTDGGGPTPATFAPNTQYIAYIVIVPDSNWTLTGVSSNFFTVNGSAMCIYPMGPSTVGVMFPLTQAYATAPSSITLAKGSTNPVDYVTNVSIPAAGATDTHGKVTGWVDGTANNIKFTVADNGGSSTITTDDGSGPVSYNSGDNYPIAAVLLRLMITFFAPACYRYYPELKKSTPTAASLKQGMMNT